MKRFKQIALLTMVSLMLLTPATIALADSGGFSTSFHSLSYGYNGSAHYTQYSIRYQKAYTSTYAKGYGVNTALSGIGKSANSRVSAPSGVYHTHYYAGAN